MDALTAAYQSELKKTRLAVSSHVGDMFRRLPGYSEEHVPDFVARAVPIVEAGESRAIALTTAYASRVLGVAPVGVDVPGIIGNLRNGVSAADVYARPFVTVRAAIATIGFSAAVIKGTNRLMSTANMDVQMASRDALAPLASAFGSRVTGWTRVADPGCCDYCIMLDGVTTGPAEPQPLHNNCGCTATPDMSGSSDFGSSSSSSGSSNGVSSLVVGALAAGAVIGLAAIHEHGELGPVITNKHDDFTSFDDLPRAQRRAYEAAIEAQ